MLKDGRVRRTKSLMRMWWLTLAMSIGVCLHSQALAQNAPYDPYLGQSGTANGPGNPTNDALSPYGVPLAPSAAQQQTGAGINAAGGVTATTGAGIGQVGPTVITSQPPATSSRDETLAPTTRPSASSALGAPVYLRPGTSPGQFELFSRPPPQPNEFESFIMKALGRPLRRFGASLVLNEGKGFATPSTTTVPPDYTLNPGDELLIDIAGSVEAQLRLVIDSEGRIFIPRLGSISLAGMRYGDLEAALSRKLNEQYKQAKLSVVISHLHGLTIYVTGYAVSPGAFTVSSLSTMVDAVLAAGGPSAGGSYRSVQLRRNGVLVTTLDLYELLINGDKSHDVLLQNNDVLNIAPAGPEVAVTGSVNDEAIYEAKAGESLADLIRYAGGLNSLADNSRLVLVRLGDLDATGSRQLSYAQALSFPAERGDIIRVLSLADISRPQERQSILVTLEGEVDHPGRYYLPANSTIGDLLTKAGGLTPGAFTFGTDFTRESVRRQQEASFDRAIDDLQLSAAAAPLSSLNGTADKAASAQARAQATSAVIERLKQHKPDGRFVLDVDYGAVSLPGDLALEDNDHIFVPPRPKTVGVFGAVYQPGAFRFRDATRISDYLRQAGGPRKIADKGEIFVVRANGAVLSSQQVHDFPNRPALAGDVIFVPVRTSPSAFEKLRDVAEVVYQLGVGAATLGILAAQF